MLRRLILPGALFAALAAWLPACTWSADDKKDGDAGFVQLFNGKDLNGWTLPADTNPREIEAVVTVMDGNKVVGFDGKLRKDGSQVHLWRVEDGLLVGSGPHSHLFTTRGNYANFVFRVEAMINDHGNSGQYFRTQLGRDFPRGYEAQINATHGDKIRTGSLYPAFRQLSDDEKKQLLVFEAPNKPDEWFTQEVTAEGNHIVIKVNDKTTVDFTDAKSTFLAGHFALQGHDPGTVVKFRKIEVKELPAEK
jgi:hypothetical protein